MAMCVPVAGTNACSTNAHWLSQCIRFTSIRSMDKANMGCPGRNLAQRFLTAQRSLYMVVESKQMHKNDAATVE